MAKSELGVRVQSSEGLPFLWATFSTALLAYLYLSRFVPDVALVIPFLIFALFGRLKVNMVGLCAVSLVAALMIVQLLLGGGRIEHPAQLLHLLFVLVLVFTIDDCDYDSRILTRFCLFTTALNCALLFGILVPRLQEVVLWGLDRNYSGRFQSILPEPSFLALYSALNFFVLLRAGYRFWALANLAPLIASFSFSGAILMGLLGVAHFRSAWRPLLWSFLLAIGLIVATYLVVPETFTSLVVSRASAILAGGDEESMTLRLRAPLDLIGSVFNGGNALFGLGIGNVEYYLQVNQGELTNHWRADGTRSTQPDSVIAFVFAAFGLLGGVVVVATVVLLLLWKGPRREYAVLRWYVAAMAIFSGVFISFHFLVWFYYLRQESMSLEDSSVGAQAPLSAR